jgi:adenine-specific DNA-methyltransferase
VQLELDGVMAGEENPSYLTDQLITYLGNKRQLIKPIDQVFGEIKKDLDDKSLKSCDVFTGSGVIARLMKKHSSHVFANDLEKYATTIANAYLANENDIDIKGLQKTIKKINEVVDSGKGPKGFFAELYAPKDDNNIKPGERVFYTNANARRIDAYAQLIQEAPRKFRDLLYAPLLSSASIHANTGGVFKGFYKDSQTGLGKFGGNGADALKRILSPITLEMPTFSNFNTESTVFNVDAAELPALLPEIDVAYMDPPYNQHPYGSNYFMLNLIVNYVRPSEISDVSGIPADWNRSDYNKKKESMKALTALCQEIPSRYIVLSFSDDGFLDPDDLVAMFSSLGKTKKLDIDYNTYRASRNLENRAIKIKEHLFICKKK